MNHYTPAFRALIADLEQKKNSGAGEQELNLSFRDGCLALGHIERIRNLYRIQDKLSRSASFFIPNKNQLRYLQTRQGRDIILKIRQVGFTTLSCVRALDLALWEPNLRTGIMAHKNEVVSTIFGDIVKFTYEWFVKDWGHFYNPTSTSDSATALSFSDDGLGRQLDSSMRVLFDFRGKTVHFLHVSEASRVDRDRFTGSLQGVPINGEVVLESTPNGRGGEFFRLWQLWREKGSQAPYKGHFVPWYDHYPESLEKVTLASGKRKPKKVSDFKFEDLDPEITQFEKSIVEDYSLTPDHIRWRRWCIDTNCAGSEERFDEEYPADDVSCFLAGDNQVFPPSVLKKHDATCKLPERTGFLVQDAANTAKVVDDKAGWYYEWVPPKPLRQYSIGADPASGAAADASCAYVIDNATLETVACLHGKIPPDTFAEQLKCLGLLYNSAFICVESNNHGHTVITLLKQPPPGLCYRYMYKRRGLDRVKTANDGSLWGFQTTVVSKLPLTERLRIAASNADPATRIKIYDAGLVNEMSTFIQGMANQGAYVTRRAAEGAHDDRVMAIALALEMRDQRNISSKNDVKVIPETFDTFADILGSKGNW